MDERERKEKDEEEEEEEEEEETTTRPDTVDFQMSFTFFPPFRGKKI